MTAGVVTRCPIELRLKCSNDQNAPWNGRVFCENDKKEKMDVTLSSPSEAANTIMRGEWYETFLVSVLLEASTFSYRLLAESGHVALPSEAAVPGPRYTPRAIVIMYLIQSPLNFCLIFFSLVFGKRSDALVI